MPPTTPTQWFRRRTRNCLPITHGILVRDSVPWDGGYKVPETDIHLSHGLNVHAPTDTIVVLRDKFLLHNPNISKWRMSLAGSSSCDRNGTENMQGRLDSPISMHCRCFGIAMSRLRRKSYRAPQCLSVENGFVANTML